MPVLKRIEIRIATAVGEERANTPEPPRRALIEPAFALALLLASAACTHADTRWGRFPKEPEPQFQPLEPAFHNRRPELGELSGLARTGEWIWAHNDSSDQPRIFRARKLDFSDAIVFPISDAESFDWEEITILEGDLIVCDTGDNRRERDDLMLYRVAPSDGPLGVVLTPKARYPIRYPDGKHDCEAAFAIGSSLYLVSKDRGEGTSLYRFDGLRDKSLLAPGEANVGVFVTKLHVGDREMVTAATLDEAGANVYLLTYGSLCRFAIEDLLANRPVTENAGGNAGTPRSNTEISRERGLPKDFAGIPRSNAGNARTDAGIARPGEGVVPRHTILTWMRQAEAMCFVHGSLVIANEERDVFVLDQAKLEEIGMAIPERPVLRLPKTPAWTDVPLRNAVAGEALRWSVSSDRLLLEGRFRYEPSDSLDSSSLLQSGVVLGFARADRPRADGEEVLIGIRPTASGAIAVEMLNANGNEFTGRDLPGGEASGSSRGGWLEFNVALPVVRLGWSTHGDERPLLFDLHGYGLREGAEAYVAGPGIFALERPYTWAIVRIAD